MRGHGWLVDSELSSTVGGWWLVGWLVVGWWSRNLESIILFRMDQTKNRQRTERQNDG